MNGCSGWPYPTQGQGNFLAPSDCPWENLACPARWERPSARSRYRSAITTRRPSMSMLNYAVQRSTLGLHTLEQYEPLVGAAAVERIAAKADRVRTMRVAHISSTFYGGGVTELLTPLTLMMNATGIKTDWHLIQGSRASSAAPRNFTIRCKARAWSFRMPRRQSTNRLCSRTPHGFILTIATRSSCTIPSLCR